MPITRRRRANPPDQPENTNHLVDQAEQVAEASPAEQTAADNPQATEHQSQLAQHEDVQNQNTQGPLSQVARTNGENGSYQSFISPPPLANGERIEREYTPAIEGGRRTARGELFRRPPQPPVTPPVTGAPLQPPSHEISLPLGNLLHLAYNPGYTGSEEARSALLQQLASESKAGGRARCWSCGSLAIAYDCWNTRSKTFGEVGVAFCEICGVWSVL